MTPYMFPFPPRVILNHNIVTLWVLASLTCSIFIPWSSHKSTEIRTQWSLCYLYAKKQPTSLIVQATHLKFIIKLIPRVRAWSCSRVDGNLKVAKHLATFIICLAPIFLSANLWKKSRLSLVLLWWFSFETGRKL